MKKAPKGKPLRGLFTLDELYGMAGKAGGLACPYCGKEVTAADTTCGWCHAVVDTARLPGAAGVKEEQ